MKAHEISLYFSDTYTTINNSNGDCDAGDWSGLNYLTAVIEDLASILIIEPLQVEKNRLNRGGL